MLEMKNYERVCTIKKKPLRKDIPMWLFGRILLFENPLHVLKFMKTKFLPLKSKIWISVEGHELK